MLGYVIPDKTEIRVGEHIEYLLVGHGIVQMQIFAEILQAAAHQRLETLAVAALRPVRQLAHDAGIALCIHVRTLQFGTVQPFDHDANAALLLPQLLANAAHHANGIQILCLRQIDADIPLCD